MDRISIRPFASLVLFAFSLSAGDGLFAAPRAPQDSQSQAANTRQNRGQSSPTADQQKSNPTDRALTQKIRKSIMADKDLSTYAHNVKIITQNGKVTLRGPVRTDDEKRNVEAKAAEIAGQDNVTSQIEVAPTK